MKALLKKASDWDYHKNIEINSLEELLAIYDSLIIETGEQDLNLDKHFANECGYSNDFEMVITIYDNLVE